MFFKCPHFSKIVDKTNKKMAEDYFICDTKRKLNIGFCSNCDGPKEISVEKMLVIAAEDIWYEDEDHTTTLTDNIAICPYCGTEIDVDCEYAIEYEGETTEIECSNCEKKIIITLQQVVVTKTYLAVKAN